MTVFDILNVELFSATLQERGRLLGLDLGRKSIGIAISDSNWKIASPLLRIKRRKFRQDVQQLIGLIETENIQGLVLGWPLNMNGSEGPRTQSTYAFERNLKNFVHLPTLFWDERLSSLSADKAMLEGNLSRIKRAHKIDKIAASIILQSAINCLSAIQKS
ncbi:Holliday junction resolvase RuvX [Candidatus Endowatersipora endosymbiont of Watersipora subatra]|uniref:Holliday junction resolvase RuvX n=1 Tax=Candidatus Endowatersipora endosymbiont of Watersipora subatra TaxID=3077946 RepID=UPI00312C8D93